MHRSEAGALGAWGEEVAARHLEAKGLEILARNWRNPRDRRDELDLVCREGALIVFVEVKTRRSGGLVRGLGAVDLRKRRALLRAIHAFLDYAPGGCRPEFYRFDVVEVEHGAGRMLGADSVLHLENIPLFRGRWG